MLCRLACLCALILPLGGCLSYTSVPAPPGTVIVVPPAAQSAPTQEPAPYVR